MVAAGLLLLLMAVRGTLALPRQGSSSSPRVNRLGDNALKVMWSAPCSPRLALLRHRQDAVLECELYAPAGTTLVWFKDEAQVLPEAQTSRHTLASAPEVIIQRRARRRRGRRMLASPKGIPLVRISTNTYIDCASTIHQGNYTLKATTPSQHVYLRHFTVTLTGKVVSPAMTCFLGPARMEQIPRVWQYARRAQGRHGKRMVLPCRVVEHDVDMTTNWYFRGKQLGRGRNTNKYEVLSSGDLMVKRTRSRDAGLYTCIVHNTLKPYLFDRVHTWLIMPRRVTASP